MNVHCQSISIGVIIENSIDLLSGLSLWKFNFLSMTKAQIHERSTQTFHYSHQSISSGHIITKMGMKKKDSNIPNI